MLESSSTPCFIHTLKLIIKDLLFSENNISVLTVKTCQTVGHFNHSSTAYEKLNQGYFRLLHQIKCKKPCYLFKMLKQEGIQHTLC